MCDRVGGNGEFGTFGLGQLESIVHNEGSTTTLI